MTGLPPLAGSGLGRVLAEVMATQLGPTLAAIPAQTPQAATPQAQKQTPTLQTQTSQAQTGSTPTAPAQTPSAPAASVQANVQTQATQRAAAVNGPPPPPNAPVVQAPASSLVQAVRQAVATQDGMAPLLANLQAVATSAQAPPAVSAAAQTVLSQALPVDPPPSAADVRQAVQASGLFLEQALASGQAPAAGDMKAALLTLAQVLETWTQSPPQRPTSAARPAQPSPVGASSEQAPTEPSPPAEAPASQVTAQIPTPANPEPEQLASTQAPPSPSAPSQPPDAEAEPAATPSPPTAPAADAARTGPPVSSDPPAPTPLAQAEGLALAQAGDAREPLPQPQATSPLPTLPEAAEAPIQPPQRPANASRPPPPTPGGALLGQPPAEPSLAPDAPAAQVAGRLLAQVSAALDRHTLMQAASAAPAAQSGPSDTRHWLFEIPLATPNGVAVAPFEIDREGGGGQGAADTVWRAGFSLDLPSMGPVHARVSLRGGAVRVALWADADETRGSLSRAQDELVAALAEEGLEPKVQVLVGAPPRVTPAPPGRFRDTAI